MSQKRIPREWCDAVAAALKAQRHRYTATAFQRFQQDFPSLYKYDLETAFITALSSGTLTGCHVTMAHPPGDTWEFFFLLDNIKTYGKILLRDDGSGVIIHSAHFPERTHLSCD